MAKFEKGNKHAFKKGCEGGPGADPMEFTEEQLAQVADLAYRGASTHRIAIFLGIDHHTAGKRLAKVIELNRARRHQELLDAQTRKAMMGDTVMLIWLGKNELEQTDRLKNEHGGEVKIVVEYVDVPIEERLEVPTSIAADVAVAAKPAPEFPIVHDVAPIVSHEDERLKKSGLSPEQQQQVKEYRESRAILQRTFPNARWN